VAAVDVAAAAGWCSADAAEAAAVAGSRLYALLTGLSRA